MSIVIKSNTVATQHLGNVHSLNGPADFDTMLNFDRGLYSVGGIEVNLLDAIAFSRTSIAEYIDHSGVRRIAAANEPRIHRLASGRSGLLLESMSTNLYPAPDNPTSRTITVNLVGGTQNYLSLQVWGAGSATISTVEPAVAQTQSLEASEGSPAMLVFAPGARSISVSVTVTGALTRINLANTRGDEWGDVLQTPVPVQAASRSVDVASLASTVASRISTTAGTLVFGYSRNRPSVVGGESRGDWFSLRSSGGSSLAGVHVRSVNRDAISVSGYDQSGAAIFPIHQIPMADTQSRAVALAWDGGGATIRLACNGIVSQSSGGPFPLITGLGISGESAGIAYAGRVNAALTHLVHYDRALSAAELQEVTSSWA